MKKIILSYRDIILLSLITVPIGIAAGLIDTLFGRTLLLLTDIRASHPFWFLPFLPLIGVFLIWCFQKFGGRSSKGMALIFETGHGINPDIPLRLIPFSIGSTWLTHLFGGSAGREGVAIQIGGTIGHWFGRRLPIKDSGKILLIAGMAAGFSGLFRTPIAAAFFALEVLTVGILEQKALLPALTASFTASYVSGLLGLEKFSFLLTEQRFFSWELVPRLLLMGVLFGITGGLFSLSLHKTKQLLAKWITDPMLRIFILGIAISIFSLLCWKGRYSGLGTNLISMSFEQGIFPWDFAFKLVFTVLTLSAGFQGGEVTPLFSIGASLGVVLGSLLGLPTVFAAALGYAAVFGSATNTLIAPMLMGAEIFGFQYFPFFAVVCSLSYVCNCNFSIYPLQKRRD
ncbi:chloride channel protein [Lacrimispora sp. JR3]|uniref:chloride channel protein n=1 Tax=Lacrimispora sinapis TaxID=3111456 RepID=UPI0037482B80